MTLLNAAEYNEARETTKMRLLIGIPIVILLAAVIALAGAFTGHGYFFMNLPIEHRVSVFLSACQTGDYEKAYGIWWNDPNWKQHPEKYPDYPYNKFLRDFRDDTDWHSPVKTYHVDLSKRDDTGTVVAATINNSRKKLFLKYQRNDGTLAFTPMIIEY